MSLPLKLNFSDYDKFLTDPDYTTSAEAQDYFRNMDMLVEALIDVGLWQPETNYPNGHVVFSPNMPNGTEAVCVATNGGKSSNTEPSWGEVGGDNVSDGTCFWHLRHKVATVNGLEPDDKGNIQIPVMTGSNGNTVGKDGLVPAPPVTQEEKFLSNTGEWKEAGKVKSVNGETGDVIVDVPYVFNEAGHLVLPDGSEFWIA